MTDSLAGRVAELTPGEVARVFDETSFWCSRFGHLFCDRIDVSREVEALDLGCGTGFPTLELAHMFGEASRFTGVDVWGEALARAEGKRRLHGTTNARFVRADVGRLPFPDDRFDLIVSNLGINNFDAPRITLFECARVARPGARIVLTTNVTGHMQEFYDLYRRTLVELGHGRHLERLEENEKHRLSRKVIERWLADCGFRVVRGVEETFRLRYRNGRALLNHPLTRLGFLDGWRAVVEPEDEAEVFATIEKKLDELAPPGEGLGMTVPMLYLEARMEEK